MSVQIYAYLFQPRFPYLSLSFDYWPVSVSIPCLSISIFLYLVSVQIDAYLFQLYFIYLSLILIYPPIYIFISFLSTTISFYLLFIQIYIYLFQLPALNLGLPLVYSSLSLPISLSIQIHAYLFQTRFVNLFLFVVYPRIFVSILCLSTSISLHHFLNPDSCLSLSTPSSIHLYIFLCVFYPAQSLSFSRILTYIYFYLFANINLRLYLPRFFSLF